MALNKNTINHEEGIYSEQVALLYKSLRISAVGTILGATIFVAVGLQYSTQMTYLFIWFAAISILSLVRLFSYFLYIKSSPVSDHEYWGKLFFYGVVAAALLWGGIGIFSLNSNNEIYLTLTFLMLMGVNSFAVTTLAYIKKYMYVFYSISIFPFFFIQVTSGSFFSYIMLALIMLFTVLIFSSTNRIYHFFEQNFCLQRETEVKNKELINANKAKSDFLSNMSHELRTPLNAINGFSQVLLLNVQKNLNEDQLEQVETILSSGEHLLSLINQILDHAQIVSGKMESDLEPTDPAYIISCCIPMVEHLAEKRGIFIDNQIGDLASTQINVDQQKLKQVFLNLLSNAIKYNVENGRVTIQSKISDNKILEIGIIDTGNGLSKDQQEKLFRPFERISKNVEGIEGTGLGLVICKQLIDLMDGDIYVLSTPGEGSEFWVKFPIL